MSGGNTHAEILLAGAFAAFTIDLLVYPLDTIKTRMQSRDYIKTYAQASTSSSGASATATVVRRAAPSAYALRGLYQGIGSVIIATLPASGVFFTTYENAKSLFGSILPRVVGGGGPGGSPGALVHSLSSGVAELASCLVLAPAEVIKQNAQMIQLKADGGTGAGKRPPTASSSLHALQTLLRAEGSASRRLWSGYSALVARNLPYTALQFPVFEALRVRLRAWWDGDGSYPASMTSTDKMHRDLMRTGVVNGLSAGTSGALAAVITTPTDVVKTRMMLSAAWEEDKRVAGAAHESPGSAGTAQQALRKRPNGLQLAQLIYRDHGVRGLFRGGALRAGWTFVGSGLYLGTYETAKAWLRHGREVDGGL